MFYAFSWFVVAALVALWSVAAWALHALAVWTVSHAGVLTGVASGVGAIQFPAWLAPWMPPGFSQWASQVLAGLAPWIESLLQAAPALTGGLTVVTWVIWGIGSALLLVLGAGAHLLMAVWQRRRRGAFRRSPSPVAG